VLNVSRAENGPPNHIIGFGFRQIERVTEFYIVEAEMAFQTVSLNDFTQECMHTGVTTSLVSEERQSD